MSTLPAANYLSDAGRTEGEMKTALEDLVAGIKQIPGVGIAETTLAIASGSVTPSSGAGGIFSIDTEGAAASDDLTNIVQTNLPNGSLLLVRSVSSARLVTVKHSAGGAGQFSMKAGGDMTLGDPSQWLLIKRTSALWEEVARFPSADRAAVLTKTANYTTTAADRSKLIDCTSGSFTVSLLAAAVAGRGFEQPIKNSGTGVVTLDPNSAETLDGVTTLPLNPGDEILIACDGSNWKSMTRYTPAVGSYGGRGWNCKNNAGTPNTQFDLAANHITLCNPTTKETFAIHNPAGVTNNIALDNSNANGRDQAGAFSAGFVHFYYVWGPAVGLRSRSSANAPPTGPTLQSGELLWCYAGPDYYDGSALRAVRIRGSWVWYETGLTVLSAGGSQAEVGVSLGSAVSPNGLAVNGYVNHQMNAVGGVLDYRVTLRCVTAKDYQVYGVRLTNQDASGLALSYGHAFTMPNVSQNIYYQFTVTTGANTSADIIIQGYSVPNGGE